MRTIFLVLLLPICFAVLNSASAKPWYNARGKAATIEIFFEKSSLNLKPYYHSHIKNLVLSALQNPKSRLMINHKDNSVLSKIRAARLRKYIISKFFFPPGRIVSLSGLAPSYLSKSGENVLLFLDTKSQRSKAVSKKNLRRMKQRRRKVAIVQNKPKVFRKRYNKTGYEFGTKPKYVYIKRIQKPKNQVIEGRLGFARHSFSNTSNDLTAVHLSLYGQKRFNDVISFTGDFSYGFSNSSLTNSREYNYALGVLNEFKDFNTNTKIYRRNTWAWVASDSKFVTLTDIGLHQGLDFDLFKNQDFLVNLGVWAELSFSNTVPGLESTNVMSFSTEITYEWFNPNLFMTLFFTKRKYKVFETSIGGLNLGYRF